MSKNQKNNEAMRVAALGGAIGAAAGASAGTIPDAMRKHEVKPDDGHHEDPPVPKPPKPVPEKPEEEEVEEIDVITDPDNPIDIQSIASTIAQSLTDIEYPEPPAPVYGPPSWFGYPDEPTYCEYAGPVDSDEPWDGGECVYAGPIDEDPLTLDDDPFLDQ